MNKLEIRFGEVENAISVMREVAVWCREYGYRVWPDEWLTVEELITPDAQPENFCSFYDGEKTMNIRGFWDAVLRQDADAIREYFHPDARVNWHNTNEHFTVEEFIRANCEYPGEWDGEVERIITTDAHIITATYVYNKDGSMSCHATSFIRVVDGKIASVDEYWGDDGPAPQWRQDKHIGTKIKE